MSTDTVSPLRERIIEDMSARKLCAGTLTVISAVEAVRRVSQAVS